MWTYKQSTGELFDANGKLAGNGYSGSPAGKNNPAMQNVPFVGPIPRGAYTVGDPHDSPKTGTFTLDLTPDATNQMFGRDEFRMHGDSIKDPGTASDGCIIMPRTVRDTVWQSVDHRLQVVE